MDLRIGRDRDVRAGLWQALAGGRWVLRERAPVGPSTELAWWRLEETGDIDATESGRSDPLRSASRTRDGYAVPVQALYIVGL